MSEIYASAKVEAQAQFYDLDPMNVVWHGHYAKFFELARCAVLEKIGYGYAQMEKSGYAWPVIDMHTRYIQPITLNQDIIIHADIVECEFRLKILYEIRDKETDKRLCKGHTEQVAVNWQTKEMELASPSILLEKLGVSL